MESEQPVRTRYPTHEEIIDPTPIGIFLTDAFGVEHACAMPLWCWHYLLWWLKHGYHVAEWVKECDMVRGDISLEQFLIESIAADFDERKERGRRLPPWLANGDYV